MYLLLIAIIIRLCKIDYPIHWEYNFISYALVSTFKHMRIKDIYISCAFTLRSNFSLPLWKEVTYNHEVNVLLSRVLVDVF